MHRFYYAHVRAMVVMFCLLCMIGSHTIVFFIRYSGFLVHLLVKMINMGNNLLVKFFNIADGK